MIWIRWTRNVGFAALCAGLLTACTGQTKANDNEAQQEQDGSAHDGASAGASGDSSTGGGGGDVDAAGASGAGGSAPEEAGVGGASGGSGTAGAGGQADDGGMAGQAGNGGAPHDAGTADADLCVPNVACMGKAKSFCVEGMLQVCAVGNTCAFTSSCATQCEGCGCHTAPPSNGNLQAICDSCQKNADCPDGQVCSLHPLLPTSGAKACVMGN